MRKVKEELGRRGPRLRGGAGRGNPLPPPHQIQCDLVLSAQRVLSTCLTLALSPISLLVRCLVCAFRPHWKSPSDKSPSHKQVVFIQPVLLVGNSNLLLKGYYYVYF